MLHTILYLMSIQRNPLSSLCLEYITGTQNEVFGEWYNILSLEAMKNMFEIAATNLKMAWEKGDPENNPLPTKLQPGDTVLVLNHTGGPLYPKYVGNYCVVALRGNQVEVGPSVGGPTKMKHAKHVKYILPADWYIKQIPDYSAFGRKTTLRINPDKIPDLHWNLTNIYHTTNIGQTDSQTMWISTHCINVDTLSHAEGNKYGEWCGITLSMKMTLLQSNVEPTVCPIIINDENKIWSVADYLID